MKGKFKADAGEGEEALSLFCIVLWSQDTMHTLAHHSHENLLETIEVYTCMELV